MRSSTESDGRVPTEYEITQDLALIAAYRHDLWPEGRRRFYQEGRGFFVLLVEKGTVELHYFPLSLIKTVPVMGPEGIALAEALTSQYDPEREVLIAIMRPGLVFYGYILALGQSPTGPHFAKSA